MPYYTLIYLSKAVPKPREVDVLQLAADAAAKNEKVGITGLLLAVGNFYVQFLEGERVAVVSLVERIKKDRRHSDLKILHEGREADRAFGEWGMAHLAAAEIERVDMTLLRHLREEVDRVATGDLPPSERMKDLIRRIPAILLSSAPQKRTS